MGIGGKRRDRNFQGKLNVPQHLAPVFFLPLTGLDRAQTG
jgi:hypothetical protein